MTSKPNTIDDYLAHVTQEKRAALEKLRRAIKAAAPEAVECISYGLAAFRLHGKPLVAMGESKNHCSFFPMDGTTVAAHAADLKEFETSKGTIRFAPSKPLPASLVRKIIKARVAQIGKQVAPKPKTAKSESEVRAFIVKLKHARKKEIESLRQIILGVSPLIREGIKWNSPSFRTTEYFATLNPRQGRVWLILHTGAKPKKAAPLKIADPKKLLQWLGKDRCLFTFDNAKDIAAKRKSLRAIIRQWIKHLPGV